MQNANLFLLTIVPLAAVGVVQVFNQFKARDWEGMVTIGVAALIGLVAGLTHYLGLDLTTSLTIAMGAVGVHTVTKNIG